MPMSHPVSERSAALFHLAFAAYYLVVAFVAIAAVPYVDGVPLKLLPVVGATLAFTGLTFHLICSSRHWAERKP